MNSENPQDDTTPSTASQELIDQLSKEAQESYRQVQPLLNEAKQAQRTLQPFLESIDTLVAQAAQQFNDFLTEVAANATRQVNKFIAQVGTNIFENLKPFYDLANHIREFEKAFRLAEGEAARILKKYKWFFTPSMPTDFMFKVVELGSQAGNQRGNINRIFVEYYTSNDYSELESLIDSWSSNALFIKRMKILRDCFYALKYAGKRYNPSNVILPSLIAQIDGILTDYINSPKRGNQFKNTFKNQTQNEYLPELLHAVLLEKLFQFSDHGKPLKNPFTFSRHKVMHGESVTYGRIDNTIRAFLILDFLANL